MATVYGTNATNAFNTTPVAKTPSSKAGGRVRWLNDTYEAAAAADGTVILMGGKTIPAGAQILPSTTIQIDDLGTGGTIDLILVSAADGTTQTSIVAGLDAGSAATFEMDDIGYIGTFPYTVAAESYIAILIDDAAATGTIVLNAQYTVD